MEVLLARKTMFAKAIAALTAQAPPHPALQTHCGPVEFPSHNQASNRRPGHELFRVVSPNCVHNYFATNTADVLMCLPSQPPRLPKRLT